MMREKENSLGNKDLQDTKQKENEHLSDSIANAHASGDGAIERGKDTLIASDDDKIQSEVKPGDKEAY